MWFFRFTFLYRTCRIYRIRWKSMDVINMPETEKAASCDGFWGRKSMLWITSDSETRNDKRSHKTSHIQELIVSKSIPLVAISSTSTVSTEAPVLKRRNILPCHGSLDFHSQVYRFTLSGTCFYYHPPPCFLSVSGFFWVFCKWNWQLTPKYWSLKNFSGGCLALGGFRNQRVIEKLPAPGKPPKRLKTGWFNFLRKKNTQTFKKTTFLLLMEEILHPRGIYKTLKILAYLPYQLVKFNRGSLRQAIRHAKSSGARCHLDLGRREVKCHSLMIRWRRGSMGLVYLPTFSIFRWFLW